VTASHCSAVQWQLDSGPIYQPGPTRQVGVETVDPSAHTCGVAWTDECRDSDASFFALSTNINSYRGLIARTREPKGPGLGPATREVDTLRPYFFVDAVDDGTAYVGQYVHKVGRTTGWTWGQITATCVDQNAYDWPNSKITECGYEADFTNEFGDSGAPVFMLLGGGYNQQGDLVGLVGTVIGNSETQGRTIVSKWTRIVSDLGPLVATRSPMLTPPSLSGSMPFLYPSLSWSAVTGTTRYNVFRGSQLVGTTSSTSLPDAGFNVLEYTGGFPPSYNGVPYVVYAVGVTDYSPKSNTIWFRAANGAFSVTITGPSVVGPNNFSCSTWAANVVGASEIISYTWSGHFSSSDGFVQGTIPQSGADFQVIVQDSQGRVGGNIKHVDYDPNNTDYCQ